MTNRQTSLEPFAIRLRFDAMRTVNPIAASVNGHAQALTTLVHEIPARTATPTSMLRIEEDRNERIAAETAKSSMKKAA